MPEISISVRNKIAQPFGQPQIICGNSDYNVRFDFDAEWAEISPKTVRFVWVRGGQPVYADVLTEDDTAAVPVLYGTYEVAVGVYAGNICTTSPARIPCAPCITDEAPSHDDPSIDVYDQLLAYLAQMQSSTVEGNAAAERRGSTETTVGAAVLLSEEAS